MLGAVYILANIDVEYHIPVIIEIRAVVKPLAAFIRIVEHLVLLRFEWVVAMDGVIQLIVVVTHPFFV